jgi:hypothetical protein
MVPKSLTAARHDVSNARTLLPGLQHAPRRHRLRFPLVAHGVAAARHLRRRVAHLDSLLRLRGDRRMSNPLELSEAEMGVVLRVIGSRIAVGWTLRDAIQTALKSVDGLRKSLVTARLEGNI